MVGTEDGAVLGLQEDEIDGLTVGNTLGSTVGVREGVDEGAVEGL